MKRGMLFYCKPILVSKSVLKILNSEKISSIQHSDGKHTKKTMGGCEGLGKLGDLVTYSQVHSWDLGGQTTGCDLISDLGPVV